MGRSQFAEPLNYTQIVFTKIQDCMKSKASNEYFSHVEMLADLLFPYMDELFEKQTKANKITRDLSKPYFQGMTPEQQRDYARKLFRALIDLVHRSGFMPYRSVEIIIDDEE